MRRREFITLLGGVGATWSFSVRAKQSTIPVIGFLASSSADAPSGPVEAIYLALKQAGYEIGKTVLIEYRYANNQLERLSVLAEELVAIPASVIITSGGPGPALAAKVATATIPIFVRYLILSAAAWSQASTGLVAISAESQRLPSSSIRKD